MRLSEWQGTCSTLNEVFNFELMLVDMAVQCELCYDAQIKIDSRVIIKIFKLEFKEVQFISYVIRIVIYSIYTFYTKIKLAKIETLSSSNMTTVHQILLYSVSFIPNIQMNSIH